jgi:hypothetical protein
MSTNYSGAGTNRALSELNPKDTPLLHKYGNIKNTLAFGFFQAWIEAAAARKEELIENWHQRRSYTSIIQKEPKTSIVDKVAGTLNLRCFTEYYSTDVIFYSNGHEVPGRKPDSTWVRGIEIAFEHEHSYDKNLYQEISHLLILHSKLSVLVTYPASDDLKKIEHLDYFHGLIKDSPKKDVAEQENFLMIFGYKDPFKWRGLVYKDEGWKEI